MIRRWIRNRPAIAWLAFAIAGIAWLLVASVDRFGIALGITVAALLLWAAPAEGSDA